jgi:hypothetical protein
VLDASACADAFARACEGEALSLRPLPQGRFAFAPPLDAAQDAAQRLQRALAALR